jgi:hypothetical protein
MYNCGMRVKWITAAVALVACLLFVGCGRPEDKFVGTYEGEYHPTQRELDYYKTLPKAEVDAFLNQKLNLQLNKDMTAVMDYISAGRKVRCFWKYSGAMVHVEYRQPGPQSEHFTVSNDSKTLTYRHWVFNKIVN